MFKGDFVQPGYRIRRNLVSIYELLGYEVTDELDETVHIAQFIGVENNKENISLCAEKYKINTIINYFIDSSVFNKNGEAKLSFEDKKYLNKANLVIVPTEFDKKILLENEITTRIEIVSPGINLSKFTKLSDIEKESFLKYSGLIKGEPFVLAVSRFKCEKDIQDIALLARRLPYLKFYVFGPGISLFKTSHKILRQLPFLPKNMMLKSYINEDFYKSAVLLAKFMYITRDTNCDILNILDGKLSKTQIITINSIEANKSLIDGVNCICKDSPGLLSLEMQKVMSGEYSTIDEAYKEIQNESYELISKKMESLIKEL
jgi:glycosyltransferase involved in cell wall biosynthesis